MLKAVKTISGLQEALAEARSRGAHIALVPTMGYLHEGHLSLISRASSENDVVVVSIFVNPLQFGPKEDFMTYPRDLDRDSKLAASAGAKIVFAPEAAEMYPARPLSTIDVELLSDHLCGRSRPGHFRGVCTVVNKLFNIIQPHRAYFGEKDAQQLAIIKQMVTDLNMPVQIIPIPTKREHDGLAMSSRNVFLSPEERNRALVLPRSLQKTRQLFAKGERNSNVLKDTMTEMIANTPGAIIDYIEISDTRTLQPLEQIKESALVALAVHFGKTRLIDNCTLAEGKTCF